MAAEKNMYPNLDWPAGRLYHAMKLEIPLYTPIFAMSRIAGWAAHVIEQLDNNRLIRPRAVHRPAPPASEANRRTNVKIVPCGANIIHKRPVSRGISPGGFVMDALLEKLSPGQVIALVSILCGSIVALVMIVAITKYQFQFLAEDTALKREKQQSELALKEKLVERAVKTGASVEDLLALEVVSPPEPDELNAKLAKRFGLLEGPADQIEQTLERALAANHATKKMIIEVMNELSGRFADSDAILAAIRPLCTPAAKKPERAPTAGV